MSRVPDELMQRLHTANNAFAAASAKLKDSDAMDTQERRAAAASLRSAEQVIEDLEKQITDFLHATGSGQNDGSHPSAP
jgi:hypothetical protein